MGTYGGTDSTSLYGASLAVFPKLFAAAVAVLYLIGFLVVASYLSRYGVSSFSVLQLQYLIAGVWVLGPPIAFAAVTRTAQALNESVAPDTPSGFNWRRFRLGLFSITAVPLLLYLAAIQAITLWGKIELWPGIQLQGYFFYVAMALSLQILWASWHNDWPRETPWVKRGAAPFYLTLLVTIVLAYTLWFSVRVYPLIPYSLGGGRPLTVAFIEGDKNLPDGIEADESSKRSIPYALLVATDKYYVVVSPERGEKSIEVSRESVAGMIVLNDTH
jgi:hypothetical protein